MRALAWIAGGIGAIAIVVGGMWVIAPDAQRISGFSKVADQPIFADIKKQWPDARLITISSGANTVTLERTDDGWRLREHHGYPVATEKVTDLIDQLAALRSDYVADEPPSGSVSIRDVRVRVTNQEDAVVADGTFGHSMSLPGERNEARTLVRPGSGDRTWLARPPIAVNVSPRAWLKRDIVDVPQSQVKSLDSVRADGDKVVLKQSDNRGVRITEGLKQDSDINQNAVKATVQALSNLEFDDVRPASEILSEAERDGQTVVNTQSGISYVIDWLRNGDQVWATIAAERSEASDSERVNVSNFNERHDGWAYRFPTLAVQRLRVRGDDLTKFSPVSPESDSEAGRLRN